MFDEKIKREQIDYLMKIKPFLQMNEMLKSNSEIPEEIPDVLPEIPQEIDENSDFLSKLDELTQRIQKLEEKMDNESEESIRKTKIKDQILSLLQQHKRLNASQLSNLISLSRTRCSEYFHELSMDGLTEGVIVGRQKFYKLVK